MSPKDAKEKGAKAGLNSMGQAQWGYSVLFKVEFSLDSAATARSPGKNRGTKKNRGTQGNRVWTLCRNLANSNCSSTWISVGRRRNPTIDPPVATTCFPKGRPAARSLDRSRQKFAYNADKRHFVPGERPEFVTFARSWGNSEENR